MGLAIATLFLGSIIGVLLGVLFLTAAFVLQKQGQLGSWKSPLFVMFLILGILFLLAGLWCTLNTIYTISVLPNIFSF